jgi:hypothetical protein
MPGREQGVDQDARILVVNNRDYKLHDPSIGGRMRRAEDKSSIGQPAGQDAPR